MTTNVWQKLVVAAAPPWTAMKARKALEASLPDAELGEPARNAVQRPKVASALGAGPVPESLGTVEDCVVSGTVVGAATAVADVP